MLKYYKYIKGIATMLNMELLTSSKSQSITFFNYWATERADESCFLDTSQIINLK